MKFTINVICGLMVILFLSIGSAFADTCYDPRYGYYECYPDYSSYPDQGQTFMQGAILGLFLGGILSDGGDRDGGHWGRGHGHEGGHRGHHH